MLSRSKQKDVLSLLAYRFQVRRPSAPLPADAIMTSDITGLLKGGTHLRRLPHIRRVSKDENCEPRNYILGDVCILIKKNCTLYINLLVYLYTMT